MLAVSSRTWRSIALAAAAAVVCGLTWTAAYVRPAHAATPASGTVTISSPAAWDFAPVGGLAGATDSYNLTVQLPADAASLYAPDARTGSARAAVLRIVQTWTGNDPTAALAMSASDPNGNSLGNDTFGAVNDGSDVNVLTVQNPILAWWGGGSTVTYTTTTLKDTSQNFGKGGSLAGCCWVKDQWKGATLTVTGQPPVTVAGNTTNTLTLTSPWASAPAPGTPFTVSFGDHQVFTITASNGNGTTLTTTASHAVATLSVYDLASQPQPANPASGPLFDNFHLPLALMPAQAEETTLGGRFFGEPSIGVDPRTDSVMYQAGLNTMRAKFDDSTRPATVAWKNVSYSPFLNTFSEDAILAVDRATGRTFVSQLTLVCSLGAITDNDGDSWTPAPKPCQTPPAVDHETIGAGAFHAPVPGGAGYPDAVYYCSQNIGAAECAVSLDGGLTYGAGQQMYTSAQCFGLHGHVKVAPDGTVYVPNKACGSPECLIVTSTAGPNCHPGFAVSADNGVTWTVRTVNDLHTAYYNTTDPSIGIGAKGTVYFGAGDRDGHPKIAVCAAGGAACGPATDVSGPFHIASTQLPTVVAGDDNRAAFAFLGSTTPGDDQQDSFVGTWHVYVAVTYDGGQTWTTSDATPNAPVQRGCIEFASSCPRSRGADDQRNLLDFNDMTIDKEGRILYAYTDGCQPDPGLLFGGHGPCLTDATRLSGMATEINNPTVARQACGLTLYAAFDSQAVPCSAAATTSTSTPSPAPSAAPSASALPFSSGPPAAVQLRLVALAPLAVLPVLAGSIAVIAWRRRRAAPPRGANRG